MISLTIGPDGREYPIWIGEGLLGSLGLRLEALCPKPGRIALITDENVWAFHGQTLCDALSASGWDYTPIVLPAGEATKSTDSWARICGMLADLKLCREDIIIAFGGGVIGDLAGFCAATYMRGVRCVQVPTTLLSQVDSSVGGKTAVNLPQGKNLLGAFLQPSLVLIDPEILATLPPRQWRCGMAEVVKYSAISPQLAPERLGREIRWDTACDIIEVCCKIKNDVVRGDEFDTGSRMLLNFGHTFGHALEKQGRFEAYTHGEAVAMGMVLAARLSELLGVGAAGTAERLRELLERHGLPTRCPVPPAELLPDVLLDKKSAGDSVRMVLLKNIGSPVINPITYAELEQIVGRVAQ